jgi:hypothetical protein
MPNIEIGKILLVGVKIFLILILAGISASIVTAIIFGLVSLLVQTPSWIVGLTNIILVVVFLGIYAVIWRKWLFR